MICPGNVCRGKLFDQRMKQAELDINVSFPGAASKRGRLYLLNVAHRLSRDG